MPGLFLLTLLCAVVFAAIHVFAGRLRFLDGVPRSRSLSLAGGVSVAYVFVHLLPELQEGQDALARLFEPIAYLEHHVYLMALVGLVMFYGLERAALMSRHHRRRSEKATTPAVFRLHIASFTLYNVIVGYLLLHRETPDPYGLLWYGVAMGLHFLVNDYGLRNHHRHRYESSGRWILAAAVVGGWGLGLLVPIPEAALSMVFAFLAGGIVLNVLKEELPEERQSRLWAFALGAFGYAALMLLVG